MVSPGSLFIMAKLQRSQRAGKKGGETRATRRRKKKKNEKHRIPRNAVNDFGVNCKMAKKALLHTTVTGL
jgi:hypothetical protein